MTDDRNAKAYFALLEADKEAIESALGQSLEWHLKPETKVSYIRLTKPHVDYRNRDHWYEQHAWLASQLQRFDRIFRDRVKELDVSQAEPMPMEDDS